MRFSNVLFFVTAVLAAPTALQPVESRDVVVRDIDERQTTVVDGLNQIVGTLQGATGQSLQQLQELANQIKNNVDAAVDVQVRALLKANLEAINAAIQQATKNVVQITSGAVGGIAATANNLSQTQINQLVQTLATLRRVINDIQVTAQLVTTNLTPDLRAFLSGELEAVKNSLTPFLTPVLTFLTAVRNFSAALNLQITGLTAAVQETAGIVQNLLATLGLQGIIIPSIQGLTGLLGLNGVSMVLGGVPPKPA